MNSAYDLLVEPNSDSRKSSNFARWSTRRRASVISDPPVEVCPDSVVPAGVGDPALLAIRCMTSAVSSILTSSFNFSNSAANNSSAIDNFCASIYHQQTLFTRHGVGDLRILFKRQSMLSRWLQWDRRHPHSNILTWQRLIRILNKLHAF